MTTFPYSFDRVAHLYEETRAFPADAVPRVVDAIREVARGGRILEVGVGTGRIAFPLQQAGAQVFGVDVSREMLRVNRAKGSTGLFRAQAAQLPFRDGSFEVAMTTHVLHLLGDWGAALLEIARVTRGEYLSVVERSTVRPDLDEEYRESVQRAGAARRRPGVHERGLVRVVPPQSTRDLGSFERSWPVEHVIDQIAARAYSSQWSIPEDVHSAAVTALREKYRGGRVDEQIRLEIPIWTVEQVRELAAARAEAGST